MRQTKNVIPEIPSDPSQKRTLWAVGLNRDLRGNNDPVPASRDRDLLTLKLALTDVVLRVTQSGLGLICQ
jgi:hypothetical protein